MKTVTTKQSLKAIALSGMAIGMMAGSGSIAANVYGNNPTVSGAGKTSFVDCADDPYATFCDNHVIEPSDGTIIVSEAKMRQPPARPVSSEEHEYEKRDGEADAEDDRTGGHVDRPAGGLRPESS